MHLDASFKSDAASLNRDCDSWELEPITLRKAGGRLSQTHTPERVQRKTKMDAGNLASEVELLPIGRGALQQITTLQPNVTSLLSASDSFPTRAVAICDSKDCPLISCSLTKNIGVACNSSRAALGVAHAAALTAGSGSCWTEDSKLFAFVEILAATVAPFVAG
jgi:hypothetical protein